jgi:hypothetical protein
MKQDSNPRSRPSSESATTDDVADGCALRCACGSLLARQVPGGIELKCRRCKRTLVLPLNGGDSD